nr:MAG TPA: hypothetical protein [Caudoviricetes sp.]
MNKIDDLIYAYRGRIKTETKLRNMEVEKMKKNVESRYAYWNGR